MMNRRGFIYSLFALTGVAAIILLLMIPSLREDFLNLFHLKTIVEIRSSIRSFGLWGPVFSIVLMILHSLTFIPSEVITFANLTVFGASWGFIYTWIGSMLGAYLAFFLAKVFGRPAVNKLVPEQILNRFDRLMKQYGIKGVFALRLIPVISFNALNYGCGLTKMTFWQFTWTTGLGITPAIILFALLYKSLAGMKYALIGLGIAGIAILILMVLKSRADKHFDKEQNH